MTAFTEDLWKEISDDIYPGILGHPFIIGLTTGDLPEAAFRHYVLQDSAYLESFGRGLALLAAKAEVPEEFMMFCEHARTTVIVEQALHQDFLSSWGGRRIPAWNEMSPNGLLYTCYLLRVAHERPYHEGVAAFLPCYWIYRRVGEHLVSKGSPNALYQKWIDTYSGEEFGEVVRQVLAVVNKLADSRTVAQRAAMKAHFRRTSELEYLFWDMGYHSQGWPFPKDTESKDL
jgi:thiaminase/transcriptional activator TenA